MEVVDALSGQQNARSVAELSLAASFQRTYSSLYKSIAACSLSNEDLARLGASQLPAPAKRNFWLLATDVSSHPRRYSDKLADRACVYEPTVIQGNAPITLGHQYSTVVGLPEKEEAEAAWVVPLSASRVTTAEDKELVGAKQLRQLLENPQLPFHDQLCVNVADSSYSKPACLYPQCQQTNLVQVVRVRRNRVFFRQPTPDPKQKAQRGHPCWYGERFALKEPETWGVPEATHTFSVSNRQGKTHRVEIQVWRNLLMRGQTKPASLPMHQHPFTLLRIQFYRADGSLVYKHALWLIIIGDRREEVAPQPAYLAYRQRFDLEHAYRFCKQRLLLTHYQTPEVAYEQTWWRLVLLAYLQLWVARKSASGLPRPWERYLPTMKSPTSLTPSSVQRDFSRITRQLGTPARPPKPRGYSSGRLAGAAVTKRERQIVVTKSKKKAKSLSYD